MAQKDLLQPLVFEHTFKILQTSGSTADFSPAFDLSKPSSELAATIDHTLLKPDATEEQVRKLCAEAVEYGFKSCCVNSAHIPLVASLLSSPTTKTTTATTPIPCSVIGFPLGATTTPTKVFEAIQAISLGAREIDMVISIGHLKAKNYTYVYNDIKAVVEACHPPPFSSLSMGEEEGDDEEGGEGNNLVLLKVIIETVFLTDEEKIAACYLAAEAGADFVKTSTGFSGGGASVEDVSLMRRAVAYKGDGVVKVKASAGIRSFEQCVAMLKAGAHRIGASAGVGIMNAGEGVGY